LQSWWTAAYLVIASEEVRYCHSGFFKARKKDDDDDMNCSRDRWLHYLVIASRVFGYYHSIFRRGARELLQGITKVGKGKQERNAGPVIISSNARIDKKQIQT
jgi:hypothetical protein